MNTIDTSKGYGVVMRNGLRAQIDEIIKSWEDDVGSFFLDSGIQVVCLPRRYKAGTSKTIFPILDKYPPLHISLKHSYWGAPGNYLQIGLIMTEGLPNFPKYLSVCASIVPRKDWIFHSKQWLSDSVPKRYQTSSEQQKREELMSAVILEDRVERAEKQDGYFYIDSSFVVLEETRLLKFKLWRSKL